MGGRWILLFGLLIITLVDVSASDLTAEEWIKRKFVHTNAATGRPDGVSAKGTKLLKLLNTLRLSLAEGQTDSGEFPKTKKGNRYLQHLAKDGVLEKHGFKKGVFALRKQIKEFLDPTVGENPQANATPNDK